MAARYRTCVVLLLGYPGVGKRTVGSHLADLLGAVLVDNSLINIPLLTLFKWDGKFPIPMSIWERIKPIRTAVLGTIEDLAPQTNSYVFTNVLKDDEDGAAEYADLRSLAARRESLFLSVMLDCTVEEQVRRIDTPDRRARLKGSDPEGYRRHRQQVKLLMPHSEELLQLDTTRTPPGRTAQAIYDELVVRGLEPSTNAADATARPWDGECSSPTQQARLILTCGLPGSGKTTLAKQLAEQARAVRLSPDEWKHALGIDYYDEEARVRLEGRLWLLAQELLAVGQSVVMEHGFWAREERDELRLTGHGLGAIVELHYLEASVEELWRRLEVRNQNAAPGEVPIKRSDLERWAAQFEPPDATELALFDRVE